MTIAEKPKRKLTTTPKERVDACHHAGDAKPIRVAFTISPELHKQVKLWAIHHDKGTLDTLRLLVEAGLKALK